MSETGALTQERLKELLKYDPETGLFTWIQRAAYRINIGDIAGSLNHGYITIRIGGVLYNAHRLAFLYMLGYMPPEVDHDDRVRHNNRWNNLNPATRAENCKNHPLRCDSTSGACGVSWDKRYRKWGAYISVNRKKLHLGYFIEKVDAIAARQVADLKYKFHPTHGMPS